MAVDLDLDGELDKGEAITDSATGWATQINRILRLGFGSTTNPFGALAKRDSAVGIPPGSMIDFAGSAAPAGWLLCDGTSISRTTYADLYAEIGLKWSPSNQPAATFRVPDLRRRITLGAGGVVPAGTNGPANTVGSVDGDEAIVLAESQLPAHTHDEGTLAIASAGSHSHTFARRDGSGSGGSGTGYSAAGQAASNGQTNAAGSHSHSISGDTGSTGTGASVPIMPPVAVVTKIIKT